MATFILIISRVCLQSRLRQFSTKEIPGTGPSNGSKSNSTSRFFLPFKESHPGKIQNNFNRETIQFKTEGTISHIATEPKANFYRPQVNQPPAYQAPVPQTHGVSKTDFDNYVKANDAVLRNMQNHGQTLQNLKANLIRTCVPRGFERGSPPRSGVAYPRPAIPSTSSSSPKVMNRDTEVTKDTMLPTNNGSTEDVQPPVVQVQSHNPISEPVVDPVSAPMPNQQTSIPFPSRRNDERRREKANDQIEKFYEIFRDLSFEISFTDALTLMPKFASTLKTLIENKEKLSEMARTPLTRNCSSGHPKQVTRKKRHAYGNPSPDYDPIVSNSSPTLTPFGDSDFLLLEEANAFIAINDEPISREINATYYDPEGDILILEALLNSDDKLPVIIAKDLKDEEKVALIKVIKSHKRAIAWKLSDIKGVVHRVLYCTKSVMEYDYETNNSESKTGKPKRSTTKQCHQKRVEKLLEAGLIYPISDCSMDWSRCGVYIDYRKLNEADPKRPFPIVPCMDQHARKDSRKPILLFPSMAFWVIFQFPIDTEGSREYNISLRHCGRNVWHIAAGLLAMQCTRSRLTDMMYNATSMT
ncbi:hypothetical protein Tco_1133595 [Tanacetum coccineum]